MISAHLISNIRLIISVKGQEMSKRYIKGRKNISERDIFNPTSRKYLFIEYIFYDYNTDA